MCVFLLSSRKIIFSSRVLLVVVGTPNRVANIFGQTMHVPVQQIFVPTNFTVYNTNNLGILKLSEVMPKDNSRIGFCKLPTQAPEPAVKYRVMGWGRLYRVRIERCSFYSINCHIIIVLCRVVPCVVGFCISILRCRPGSFAWV